VGHANGFKTLVSKKEIISMKKIAVLLVLVMAFTLTSVASAQSGWPPGPASIEMACDGVVYTVYWPIGFGLFFFPDGSVGHLRATWDWDGEQWVPVYQQPGNGYDASMRCVWTRPSTGTLRMAAIQVSPPK
jgi:hypothetical protein